MRIFHYVFSGFNAAVFASSVSRVFKILFLSFLRFSGSCCSLPHVHSASKQFTNSSAVSLSSPKSNPNAIKLKCGRSILKRHQWQRRAHVPFPVWWLVRRLSYTWEALLSLVRKLKGTSRSKRDVHVIRVECHQRTPILPSRSTAQGQARTQFSRALRSSDDGEGRPALLHVVAPTVRADNPFLLIVDESQDLRECFLADVTEELSLGHSCLPCENPLQASVDRCPHSSTAHVLFFSASWVRPWRRSSSRASSWRLKRTGYGPGFCKRRQGSGRRESSRRARSRI